MRRLTFRKLLIEVFAGGAEYSYECSFASGLNIIRGNNSSGKSTLLASLVYSMGMEEILGAKGSKALQYALRDYLFDGKERKEIVSSFVYLEIENHKSEVVTLKRAVSSEDKSEKLVSVIKGKYLSERARNYDVDHYYVHDPGSARIDGAGFFKFFEEFLEYELPSVSSSGGSAIKLYLQLVFSALIVEQKRGWTDYIAGVPYYGVREVKTKIVEFLLGLDVFDNEMRRGAAQNEINRLNDLWRDVVARIEGFCSSTALVVEGLPKNAVADFDASLVNIKKQNEDSLPPVYEYLADLDRRIQDIEERADGLKGTSEDVIKYFSESTERVRELTSLLEEVDLEVNLAISRISDYRKVKSDIESDLEKNKAARKLREMGVEYEVEVASDKCPSCHQAIDDSLLLTDTSSQTMDIDENIRYLDSQRKMVSRYIEGLESEAGKLRVRYQEISIKLSDKRSEYVDLKRQIRSGSEANEAEAKVRIRLEIRGEEIRRSVEAVEGELQTLVGLAKQVQLARDEIKNIPKNKFSELDLSKIRNFEDGFKELSSFFEYNSAEIEDIEINRENLLPYLSGLELREIDGDEVSSSKKLASVRESSSASDFVRLIWSYLISVFVASGREGNHPGFLVFDEPAQHSMALSSLNKLFQVMADQEHLQSIVAASFEESEENYQEAVKGVPHKLITVGSKLIEKQSDVDDLI